MSYYTSGFYSGGSTGYGRTNVGYSGSFSAQGSLLQNVIRKLEDSQDDDEKQQHYKEVQEDLAVEEDRMETLVKDNQDKLQNTLETFGKIDSTIRESQSKVRMLKDNLQVCKAQLRCKRDELKRLWLDEIKYKQMLKIVDQVEKIRSVSAHLQQLRASKQYLEATEVLLNTVAMLEGSLSGIDALKDIKTELKQLKDSFHLELTKELQHHLYSQESHTEISQQLQPPQHTSYSRAHSPSTAASPPLVKKPTIRHNRSSSRSATTDSALSSPSHIQEKDEPSDSKKYVASLVDALAMLHKIPDMLEAIQQRMNKELVLIVERAALHVIKKHNEEGIPPYLRPSGQCEHSRYLLEMMEICFKQFLNIVSAHAHLLELLQTAKQGYAESYELYSERDVWACIQQVLQGILEVYLAVDEDKPQTAMSAYTPFMIGGGHDFPFLRRRTHARGRRQPLFRFDNSRHALSINSYMKEQRDRQISEHATASGGTVYDDSQPSLSQHLVCKPCTRNITVMYQSMKVFVLKIEAAIQLEDGMHCDLYHFLQDFVEQRFLDSIQAEYTEKLDNSLKFEARQAITLDTKLLKPTGKQALHSSALVLLQSVQELHQLMEALPMYSTHFLSILLQLLQMYQDSVYGFYRDLTCVSHDKGFHTEKHSAHRVPIVSAHYARDGDINRLLRTMTSWNRLTLSSQPNKSTQQDHPGIGKDSVYAKESNNLLKGLGREVTARTHILHDHDSIKQLAVLHESMEWFAHRLKILVAQLKKFHADTTGVDSTDGASISKPRHHAVMEEQEVADNPLQTPELLDQLSTVVSDLTSLSETVLIMLHLELRSHCCYYLMPTLKQSSYVCEDEVSDVDQGVKEVAIDLTNMKTIMSGVMTQEKQRYLFDGVGHLISAIFISSTQHISKININGVKKMCRNIQHMQSCLSKITSVRERDLDLAQKYFTMLYVNEEEFLKLVMEGGKQFTQDDYAHALRLLARSQPSQNEIRLQNNIDRLEQMFAENAC